MKKEFIEEMKVILLAELQKLEKGLGGFAHRNAKMADDFTSDFPSFGDDEDENASEVATYTDNLSLENALEREYRDVKNAIKRIEDTNYGHCKYCKAEISEDRLRARPTSTSCIACKKTLTQER
ncbi:MAG: TraR/DksA family transcriptional regulator [Patescibacteria group bacterium]|jgi:DnaK suppressor protein